MIDESFHLTPLDIRRYEFGTALRGYDRASVDQFRSRVADELETMTLKNQDLETKLRNFHEQLRAFRERDKALNEALVSAQQLRGEIREQAEREGGLILREARAEADRIIDDTRAHVRSLSAEVDALDRTRRQYLAQMRILVERQLAELDAVGAAGPPSRPTPIALPAFQAAAAAPPPASSTAPDHEHDGARPFATAAAGGAMPTPAFLEVAEEA